MNPEEYLDRLIESHEQGELDVPIIHDEFTASMAAAEALTRLNDIRISHRFANSLELSIRARVRSLTEQNHWDIQPTQPHKLTEHNRWNIPSAQSSSSVIPQRAFKRRAWVTLLRIAAVLIIAGVGILTASARSLPGDALYSLNQAEKQLTLTFAGAPQSRAALQIDHLRSALLDLNAVVKEDRDDDSIRLALDTVAATTSDSQEAVAALPVNSASGETQQALTNVLAEEEQVLRQLLNSVDWPIRLAITQQLGSLGERVPTVTNVVVRPQSDGTLLIKVTGSYFAPQAQLIIDGLQNGMVRQIASTQLVADSSNGAWYRGAYAIGVRNPDGTAAQLLINTVDENSSDEQDNNSNKHGTPIPYPTGSPDD
jgi:hypothetical protein